MGGRNQTTVRPQPTIPDAGKYNIVPVGGAPDPYVIPTTGTSLAPPGTRQGKGYKQPSIVNQDPWQSAQPALLEALFGGQQQYRNKTGTELPTYSTYAGMGQGTQDAIANLRQLASQPSQYVNLAGGAAQGILNDQRYADLYGQTQGPTAADTYLTGMAAGPSETNPFLQRYLDLGSNQIGNQVRAAYSAKGRYGSEDFTDALARGVSDFQTPVLFNAYESDRNRQLAATQAIDAARQGMLGTGLSALSGETAARLGAANLAGQLDANRFAGADRLLQAGQLEDQSAQAQRDADYARFLWEHGGADQANLDRYAQLAAMMGGLGGSSAEYQPRTPFLTALSAISGFGGILGRR